MCPIQYHTCVCWWGGCGHSGSFWGGRCSSKRINNGGKGRDKVWRDEKRLTDKEPILAVFDFPAYSFTIFSAITVCFKACSWSVASTYASPMMVAANRSILNHTLTTEFFRYPRQYSDHVQWYEVHAPTARTTCCNWRLRCGHTLYSVKCCKLRDCRLCRYWCGRNRCGWGRAGWD